MDKQQYRFVCTLTFGDISAQIFVWLFVIFLTLASAVALWSADRAILAIAMVGLILVVSLPFLLFAFVTTLLNHIEMTPVESTRVSSVKSTQKPIQATS